MECHSGTGFQKLLIQLFARGVIGEVMNWILTSTRESKRAKWLFTINCSNLCNKISSKCIWHLIRFPSVMKWMRRDSWFCFPSRVGGKLRWERESCWLSFSESMSNQWSSRTMCKWSFNLLLIFYCVSRDEKDDRICLSVCLARLLKSNMRISCRQGRPEKLRAPPQMPKAGSLEH